MYFLNGDRIYIRPGDGSVSLDSQLDDCISKLEALNSGQRVFKLNFFADTPTVKRYLALQNKIEERVRSTFQSAVIWELIAQPPLTCRILVEAFHFDETLWSEQLLHHENGAAVLFTRDGARVLVGHVQSYSSTICRDNAETAFEAFGLLLEKAGTPLRSVVRQWNYIENITGSDEGRQRYQEFNNVRSVFYGRHFDGTGYPAATGIGMNLGGVVIEFVAVDFPGADSFSIDNPQQVSAHDYSEKVLAGVNLSVRSTPKFERARYLEIFGKKQIFISGTASIRGEKTVGEGDAVEQTCVTVRNMQQLYSKKVLSQIPGDLLQPAYGHARIYVKKREDFTAIKKTFKKYYGNLPAVYILADICREDLLVEIEGKVILE